MKSANYSIVIKPWMGAFGMHPESILETGSVRMSVRKTSGGNTYLGVNPAVAIKKLEKAAIKSGIEVSALEFKWEEQNA